MNKKINKIFCIGLSKTGTTSLTEALSILNIKSIHFPECVFLNSENELELDLDSFIFTEYDSFSDISISPFYKELDKKFPNSKFILTVRNIDDWLLSMKKHYLVRGSNEHNLLKQKIREKSYNTYKFNKNILIDAYKKHLYDVKKYFKNEPENFLILNISHDYNWDVLCSFLDVPVPHCEFPKKNRAGKISLFTKIKLFMF